MEFVFIDTCVYEEGLFIESGSLKTLFDAASEGRITILLPEITEREAKCHIHKRVNEERKRLERISDSILKTIPGLKEKLELSIHEAESAAINLEELFESRLQKSKVCKIPIQSDLDLQSIVDSYFNLKPPFSEKKSSEFPDAIVLKSLEQWCSDNNRTCIILSTDGDMKSYTSPLLKYQKVDTYLVDLTRRIQAEQRHEEEVRNICQSAWSKLRDAQEIKHTIEEWVYEHLDNEVLYCSALSIPDINDYSINDSIIDYSDEIEFVGSFGEVFVFKVIVTVTTEVDVNHPDYDTGYYDGEDKQWYFFDDDVKTKITSILEFPIEFMTDQNVDFPELDSINKNHHFQLREIERSFE